jgi:hypothetical protein
LKNGEEESEEDEDADEELADFEGENDDEEWQKNMEAL